MEPNEPTSQTVPSFFDRPGVQVERLPFGPGVPVGIEQIQNPTVGIGGAYGSWGESYDNTALMELIESRLGHPLEPNERMNLVELGFQRRHHLPDMTNAEHAELELEVGTRFLKAAAQANGWDPAEVAGVVIGCSGPISETFTSEIARRAGIPESAIKVSIHKACDGSVGGLHAVLNPDLPIHTHLSRNIARNLAGKKVLVGGIEGLSRFMRTARDANALQLFGNGAGVIGVIPGDTMRFLVGKAHEVYDAEGVLKAQMCYPHSGHPDSDESLIEACQVEENHFRLAGLMHEPENGLPVDMAGPMGMVKLFVRSGVEVVRDVYSSYQQKIAGMGESGKSIAVAIVHHANYKINKLKEKHLQREGIFLSMPWLLSEFGNVSAASNMIAFLRQLPSLHPGDHVLFDGFGAGTYYDALAVELGQA